MLRRRLRHGHALRTGSRLGPRMRAERGFGLVELLIAMTVLAIGILALVAAFSSSTTALVRASRVGTASSLADSQMQLYRTIKYCSIRLDDASIPGSGDPYRADSAYSASQVVDTAACGGSTPTCTAPIPRECNASRTVTGPDNRSYRVDTYIVFHEPTGTGASRNVKRVTVVVRESANLSGRSLARSTSTFDELSG